MGKAPLVNSRIKVRATAMLQVKMNLSILDSYCRTATLKQNILKRVKYIIFNTLIYYFYHVTSVMVGFRHFGSSYI